MPTTENNVVYELMDDVKAMVSVNDNQKLPAPLYGKWQASARPQAGIRKSTKLGHCEILYFANV